MKRLTQWLTAAIVPSVCLAQGPPLIEKAPAPQEVAAVKIGGASPSAFLSPWELLLTTANRKSAFDFDITVDRFDGGRYRVGDKISFNGAAAKSGYLYLFLIAPDAEPKLIYPLPGQDNRVPVKKNFTLGDNADVVFRLQGPVGPYRLRAIVTEHPVMISMSNSRKTSAIRIESTNGAKPEAIGAFAQDEVLFHVEAAEAKLDAPKKP
jgi:hypothetical protein